MPGVRKGEKKNPWQSLVSDQIKEVRLSGAEMLSGRSSDLCDRLFKKDIDKGIDDHRLRR